MNNKIMIFRIFLVLLNLCVSPCPVKAEEYSSKTLTNKEIKFATFNNARGDISVRYPEGWFIKEHKYNNPYSIFLSREKVENPTDMFRVGISIHKFYHQSWYLDLDNKDSDGSINLLVDEYFKEMPNPGKEATKEKIFLSDGTAAIKGEATFSPDNYIPIKVYVVYTMKNDVLVRIILEAPSGDFEFYRQAFDEIIATAEVFAIKGDLSDNALLDQETEQFVIKETIDKASEKDFFQIASSFNDAKAMNPLYAKTLFLMGAFYMQAAAMPKLNEKSKNLALETSQIYLNSAIEYYQKYPDNYNALDRQLNISQCYYLLGDIDYFYRNNKEAARDLYQKSLTYFDHPNARRKLEKYFND